MSVLLSVLLASVVPAAPIAAEGWFTPQEYLKTAMRVGERGPLRYAIDVAPDGRAIRCIPAGTTDLDEKVCDLIMKRANFTPATDEEGRPAHAVYDGVVSILMPGKPGRPERARLIVAMDRLPDGVTGTAAYARVAFTVDMHGAIGRCASLPGKSGRRMVMVESLGPAACDALMKGYRPSVGRDVGGNPVPSVQSAMVRFESRTAP